MNERRLTMYSYTSRLINVEAIEDYLSKGKDKTNRPAPSGNGHCNNTRILKWNEMNATIYGIKLHNTIIVRYHTNGNIILDTDGWKTVTTRDRINYYTPESISVWQERFIWYVSYQGKQYLFEDGMKFHPQGLITLNDNEVKPYSPDEIKAKKKLKAKVDKYCKAFIEKFIKQEIAQPDGGDCWLCCMKDSNSNKAWGDSDSSHLLNHIEEKYYVPSLLNNAIEEDSLGLAPMDRHNIAWCWKVDGWETYHPFAMDLTKDRLVKTIKRYINKRIGLGIT